MSNTKDKIKEGKSPLHHRYIIIILVGVIVGLLSINWSQVSGLPETLNMALALSSLILAGLAIVYSFHTSGSLSSTLDKIEEASQTMKSSSQKIEQSNEELRVKFDSIPSAIESVKKTVDGYESYFYDLTTLNNMPESQEAEIEISSIDTKILVKNFPRGMKHQLYIAHEVNKKNLYINQNSFHDEEGLRFFYGYFLATIAIANNLDLIESKFNGTDRNRNCVSVKIINQDLLKEINSLTLSESEKLIMKEIIESHTQKIDEN